MAEDIFISYSRQDATFVEQLRDALTNRGRSVWLDTSNIAPTSVWRQDIISAIEAASAVLFVISPDWLASEVSQRELNYAIEMHKKLVPVLYRDVDHRLVNPVLAEINWVLARSGDNPQIALDNILFAIDTDLQYWKQGGDLLAKAAQWNERKRQPAYTLRGEALRQAEQWMTEGASKKPAPSPLQVEYITAGRRAAAARQRTTIGALSAGIIITLVLSIIASLLAVTIQNQNVLLTAQIRQLGVEGTDNDARAQFSGDKFGLSVLLAAAAYKVGKVGDPATRKALFSVVHQSPHLDSVILDPSTASFSDTASYIGYSADGNTEAFVGRSEVTIDFAASSQPQVNFTPLAPPGGAGPLILGGALSSDGRFVAVKLQDTTNGSHITLWSATTGKQVGQLDGLTYENQTQQHDMAFSPDGRFLASAICPDPACNSTRFTIWNVHTGQIVAQVPALYSLGSSFGASVSFSHDSRYVAFTDTKNTNMFSTLSRVVVYDLQQGAVSYVLTSPTQISALAFSPSPQIMAVASSVGNFGQTQQVAFWNVATQAQVGQVTTVNDLNPIETIDFSSQLFWMLTADTLHTVNLWGVDSTFFTSPFNVDVTSVRTYLTAVALSPAGNQVTTSSEDGQIAAWRVSPFTSSSPDASLTYGTDAAITFSSDNQWLLYAHDVTGTIGSWNVVEGKAGASISNLPDSAIPLLAISRDGSQVAVAQYSSSGSSGLLTIFNRTTGKMEGSPWTSPIYDIASLEFSPDGRTLLTCGGTYAIGTALCLLWDTQTHTLIQSFGQAGAGGQSQDQEFFTGSFSPDGKSIGLGLVAASSSGSLTPEIEVYNIGAQRVTATLGLGTNLPVAMSWSPDSKYVAYVDTAGNIAIWNPVTNARPIEVTKVPTSIQPTLQFIAPPPRADSSSLWIMASSEASLQIFQIDSKGRVSQYLDPLNFENPIFSAASSPNGKYLAVGEYTTGLISVFSLDPNDWIKQACRIAGRNLTRSEWQRYVQAHFASVTVPYETLCPGLPTYL